MIPLPVHGPNFAKSVWRGKESFWRGKERLQQQNQVLIVFFKLLIWRDSPLTRFRSPQKTGQPCRPPSTTQSSFATRRPVAVLAPVPPTSLHLDTAVVTRGVILPILAQPPIPKHPAPPDALARPSPSILRNYSKDHAPHGCGGRAECPWA